MTEKICICGKPGIYLDVDEWVCHECQLKADWLFVHSTFKTPALIKIWQDLGYVLPGGDCI